MGPSWFLVCFVSESNVWVESWFCASAKKFTLTVTIMIVIRANANSLLLIAEASLYYRGARN